MGETSAIGRRPQAGEVEVWDDNGLEILQQNMEILFSENLTGFRIEELEAILDTLASARSYLVAAADGTLSVQAIAIPATDGGTGLVVYAVGDLLYADTTTTLAKLAAAAAGKVLRAAGVGVAPAYSTFTISDTFATGSIPHASATDTVTALAIASAGKVIRSTGTLPAYSTFTIPDVFATGDIIYGSATNVLTALADIATGNALISGGVGVAPSWGKIDLTAHVTGDLPYANLTQATAASLLLGRGSAAGGGDWQEITLGGNLTMTGTTISVASTIATHAILDGSTHSDSVAQGVTRGSIVYGNATPKWDELTIGVTNRVLRSDGTDISWAQVVLTTDVTGDLPFANIVQVATDRLLGRDTALTGDIEELTVGGGIEFTGTAGIQRSALTGDVTAAAGSATTAIADNAVTDTDIRDSGALSVIGRSANSSGDPADISATATSAAVLRESGSTIGFGTVATAGIADDAITYAKIQNISATDRLLGRDTALAGDTEELTVGGGIEFTGSGGIQSSAYTGDVTKAAGGTATTIANDAVTFAKMQNITAASKLLGRGSAAGSGDTEEITLGTGLTMTATTLSASGGTGGLEQAFRGLHLRTSPDNTVALTTVIIVGLDQWTADDGTVVDDTLSNNTAIITGAGAGGLDTGAEAASVWYEIYRIRKSSDGTLNTMFHRAKDWTSDVAFTTTTDIGRALRLSNLTATDNLAQGIKFASSKPFVFHDVQLIRTGAVSGNVWFTLESDTAGSPSGSVLATSDKLKADTIATSNQLIRVVFRTPYTVTATTQYHLVLHGDYTKSDTVFISWRGVVLGGYADGSAKQYNGTSWIAAAGVLDFYFNAYCEFNSAAITLPTGYDQQCKLGWVYNNSGSHFNPFVANDRLVRVGDSANSGSVTATIGTLIDWRVSVPPTPVFHTLFSYANSAAGFAYVATLPSGYSASTSGAVSVFPAMGGFVKMTASNDTSITPMLHITYQAFYVAVDASTTFYPFEWQW